jgi:NAD-dependent SIR2 family protein deacetylase
MEAADALLVVGSSLMVYSGFRFCRVAHEAGKPIAAVNLGRTRADHMIALKIEDSAERLLPQVARLLHAGPVPTPAGFIHERGVF